jgi:class 3 adenylate cyclase
LFCDLHQSGSLARKLSTAAYFKLVRRLWIGIDAVVAQEKGIIGKHAGDGASAYFLVGELGSQSASAGAAIRTARSVHDLSSGVFGDAVDDGCRMKVGLHWGGSLYMGQLVPGGRLDVAALGDEVNEAARIQECARPQQSLASKQLLERLVDEDAAALGLDLEKLRYQPLFELPTATAKSKRDGGGIPVTSI